MNRQKIKEIRNAFTGEFTANDLSIALNLDLNLCAQFMVAILLGPKRKRNSKLPITIQE